MVSVGSVWVKLGIKSTLGADVAKADAALGKLRKSAKNTAANFKELGQTLSLKVALPLTIIGGLATKTAVTFDDAMRQVQAVTGATGEDFIMLTELARDLGATTSFSAKQAAEGMIFLGRAGFSVNQIFSSLDDTLNLARATATDLGTTADILSNIMTAFEIPAENATRAVDVLAAVTASSNTDLIQLGDAMKYVAPVALQMGLSLEDTAAAAGFLSNVGIQATMAGTSLRGMLVSVASPTSSARKAMEKYGLAMEDVNPVTHDLVSILNTLNDAGVGITDTMEIFGLRAGPGTAALLKKGGGSLDAYIGKLENADGAAARMAQTMDEGPGGSIRRLKSALEGLAIEFGNIIAGGLTPVANMAQKVANAFTNLPDPVKKGIVALGVLAVAASVAVLAIGVLTPIISSAGTAFATLGTVASAIIPVISTVGLPLIALGGILYGLEKKFSLVSDTAVIAWDGIKRLGVGVKKYLTGAFDNFKKSLDRVKEAFKPIFEALAVVGGPLSEKITELLKGWHERAEAIREEARKNKEAVDGVAGSWGNAATEAQTYNDVIAEGQAAAPAAQTGEIPGYAGHTRELIEAGLAEEAGFVDGVRGGTRPPGFQTAPTMPTVAPVQIGPVVEEMNGAADGKGNKELIDLTRENGQGDRKDFSSLRSAVNDVTTAIKSQPKDITINAFFRSSPT